MAKSKPPFYLGPYKVVAELGAGGFATVYKAVVEGDMGFSRSVALKVLHSHVVAGNPTVVMMLADEARLLARMQHPNIVYVQWFGQIPHPDEGSVFAMMMEYVEGTTFRAILDDARAMGEPLPLSVVLDVHADVARGLAFAHGLRDENAAHLGLVHRDLKPDNVMISTHGAVKLLDFGIAKASDRLAEKTRTDMVRGTVHYMSPEQVGGTELDFRSDLFSFGAMLFEALTMRRLISAPTVMAALHEVATFDVSRGLARAGNLPPGFDPILRKTLAPRREDRYGSTEELVADLEALRTSVRAPQATAAFLRERLRLRPESARPSPSAIRAAGPDRPMEAAVAEAASARTLLDSGSVSPFRTGPGEPGHGVAGALAVGPTRPEVDPTRMVDSRAIRAGGAVDEEPPVSSAARPAEGTLARPIPKAAASRRGILPVVGAAGAGAALVATFLLWPRAEAPTMSVAPTAATAEGPDEAAAPTPAQVVTPEAGTPEAVPVVTPIVEAPTPRSPRPPGGEKVAVAREPRLPKEPPQPTPSPIEVATPSLAAAAQPPSDGIVRLTADRPFELVVNRKTYSTMEARRGVRLPAGRHQLRLECLDCPAGVQTSVSVSAEVVAGQTAVLNEVQFPSATP